MRKLLPVSFAVLALFSAGCEANNNEKKAQIQHSNLKDRKNMINLNLMLNEILKTRITDIASQRADVSNIVSQYLHSGLTKNEIINLITNEFEVLENSDDNLLIHYQRGEGYLGNRRDLYISLFFNKSGQLLKNVSYLDKSNNL
ncbi:hypothetical protein HMPREF3052_03355 [Neisseria sp. HMSC056A03]|uniref:hypothetical protein n=1 Tax=Neisseria sp. HMSC056A03 TaxID=1739544 RepID=UPI0008A2E5DA|nr:hypothetical protein [Neisseria sp. HMSC056A03]OFO29628.1 hypothetical protein HMPREF3052_03355 [Neisseria sp. HMSC056A03]